LGKLIEEMRSVAAELDKMQEVKSASQLSAGARQIACRQ